MSYGYFYWTQPIAVETLSVEPPAGAPAEPPSQPKAKVDVGLCQEAGGGLPVVPHHEAVASHPPVHSQPSVDDQPDILAQIVAEIQDEVPGEGMMNPEAIIPENMTSFLASVHSQETVGSLYGHVDSLSAGSPPAKRRCLAQTNGCLMCHQHHQTVSSLASAVQYPSPACGIPPVKVAANAKSSAQVKVPVTYTVSTDVGPVTVSYNPADDQENIDPTTTRRNKRAQCDLCQKCFENRYKLRLHMNGHTGKRPFVCEVCGKGFMRGPTLNAHRRIHTDSEHECPRCGRKFTREAERLMHILVQVCERETQFRRTTAGFVCEPCGKTFSSRDLLLRHLRQMHEKPEKSQLLCPVCGQDFTGQRSYKLLAHARASHPDYIKSL